ncbi:MAG: PAS domain S-box protein [Bacteroidota bacterium]|nr:PAS domain S-box protein [Bacteroidota bacterium]
MVKMFGYSSREEMLNVDIKKELYFEPSDRDSLYLATNQVRTEIFRMRRKDGSEIWVEDHGQYVHNEKGNVIYHEGILRDVTDRLQALQQLNLQSSALESTANSIVITDRDGNIQWVNPAFTNMTGYTFEEVRYKNLRVLESGKQDDAFYKNLWDTIISGKVWHGEIINKRKDGTLYNEEMTITPVRGKTGEIENFIAIKQDITQKKLVETQLLHSQRMESIGVLAGGIAHDLNNVLAPILMSIGILERNTTEQQKRMLEMLRSSAQRGAEIVKQVLTFSRGMEGEKALIQLKHTLREIETFTKQTFPKDIEIQSEVPKNLWTILGDSTKVHQVLLNLAINARDAMPKGGKLTITSSNIIIDQYYKEMHHDAKVGPYIQIRVADNGTGIPPEIIDKIFDPFFTTKEVGTGTGLGLSTVMGIVKSHNGFLNVYSEVSRGTEFKVYLPAIETQETNEAVLANGGLPKGNGELILVVDDETAICEITKSTLESYGYNVITANDGVEAVTMVVQNRKEIKVVITDMAMPNMGGAILIRALGKIEPGLKIIAAIGLVTKKHEVEELSSSIIAFLKKPYTADVLLTTLHKVLG